jgi:hypothetical protein
MGLKIKCFFIKGQNPPRKRQLKILWPKGWPPNLVPTPLNLSYKTRVRTACSSKSPYQTYPKTEAMQKSRLINNKMEVPEFPEPVIMTSLRSKRRRLKQPTAEVTRLSL